MSWETKTDYCGLAVEDTISAKSSKEGRTGQYLKKLGQDGAIKKTKAYGTANATPSNEYLIEQDHTFAANAVKLGEVTTVGGKKYMLNEVSGTSAPGAEPTLSASATQVEDAATTDFYFGLPSFTLSHEEVAHDAFSAFTLPEGTAVAPKNTDVEVTSVGFKASCKVGLHGKNGDPKASSISEGEIVVDVTLGQYGEMAPEVTPSAGWEVSSPLTCDDPDSDMPSWTVQLTKPLAKTEAED